MPSDGEAVENLLAHGDGFTVDAELICSLIGKCLEIFVKVKFMFLRIISFQANKVLPQ